MNSNRECTTLLVATIISCISFSLGAMEGNQDQEQAYVRFESRLQRLEPKEKFMVAQYLKKQAYKDCGYSALFFGCFLGTMAGVVLCPPAQLPAIGTAKCLKFAGCIGTEVCCSSCHNQSCLNLKDKSGDVGDFANSFEEGLAVRLTLQQLTREVKYATKIYEQAPVVQPMSNLAIPPVSQPTVHPARIALDAVKKRYGTVDDVSVSCLAACRNACFSMQTNERNCCSSCCSGLYCGACCCNDTCTIPVDQQVAYFNRDMNALLGKQDQLVEHVSDEE